MANRNMTKRPARSALAADRDIRKFALYAEVEALARGWYRPGSGAIAGLGEVAASPDGRRAAFSGVMLEKLEGMPTTRICLADIASGDVRVLTFGPNTDRSPRWSPDGQQLAFLSDRAGPGNFQVHLVDLKTREVRALGAVDGWVEYLHWSPDGTRLLLGVAGFGAELAGAQGGISAAKQAEALPPWVPDIEAGHGAHMWRSLWILDVATAKVRKVPTEALNIWEAVWCGPDAAIAVCSPSPGEEAWYAATLERIILRSGRARRLYQPSDQLGWLSASRSGRRAAVVEAVCSDRLIVAGDLWLVAVASGRKARVNTRGVDVTYTQWQDERTLLIAGLRDSETVIGLVDTRTRAYRELLASPDHTCGAYYPAVSGVPGRPGECVFNWEGFTDPPVLAKLARRRLRVVHSFVSEQFADEVRGLARSRPVKWKAPDGLEIHGWVHTPRGRGPFPLVMEVHGGPVWQWRPWYLARGSPHIRALLRRGYAVFHPNPRGSSGRGQSFARAVFGDMGGADTHDYLSGVDELVRSGIADPKRLGVTGGSYGGFITSWLITQDPRFAAAVAVAPVTNWVSEHLTCHIPHFCEMFLADKMTNAGGKYFSRSPVMFVEGCRTPILNVCGALDHNTPPGQALEFHRALRLAGCESVLLTYPQEGHGVRRFPAAVDFAARVVDWFDRHVRPRGRRRRRVR
jgi:dipeptidyl aminopeptidase/acylaminoacyl peptidase